MDSKDLAFITLSPYTIFQSILCHFIHGIKGMHMGICIMLYLVNIFNPEGWI